MFCAGSQTSQTYMSLAVPGMSCMSPTAPFSETARALKFDSTAMTARSSSSGSWYFSAACRTCSW